MTPRERLLVALDGPDPTRAVGLARSLASSVGGFKIGLELFSVGGPALVREIGSLGGCLFLDLKLHDIPNTAAGAAAAIARLGVSWFSVHALGGLEMIRRAAAAAREGAGRLGLPPPTALAVTVLTSHSDAGLDEIGLRGPCRDAVRRLAGLARDAGAGGIVCSALDLDVARSAFPEATVVVPGIRPAGAPSHDQARTATPAAARARGADRVVVGRPITEAPDPLVVAKAIVAELERCGVG